MAFFLRMNVVAGPPEAAWPRESGRPEGVIHNTKVISMMKKISMMALLVFAIGCNEGTPGGPGANRPANPPSNTTTTANRPTYSESDKTFTISVPVLSTTVQQGDTRDVTIGLSRGRNFDEDVTIELSGMPQGVTAEPARMVIKHSDKDVTVKMHAAADAALGDFTIHIVGHPQQGPDATNEVKMTVTEHK